MKILTIIVSYNFEKMDRAMFRQLEKHHHILPILS